MKITKFGHCCLLVEVDGVRLLTDPGTMSSGELEVRDLDAIVITHEHADHFHVPSVKAILANNPGAIVITNAPVGALLVAEGIAFTKVADGESTTVKGVAIAGSGTEHAIIYKTMQGVENTSFLIADKLYFPGDAFHMPNWAVDVLALPTAGPWMKIGEAIDFALTVKPRVAFPVHDAIYLPAFAAAFVPFIARKFIEPAGIKFESLAAGETKEF